MNTNDLAEAVKVVYLAFALLSILMLVVICVLSIIVDRKNRRTTNALDRHVRTENARRGR